MAISVNLAAHIECPKLARSDLDPRVADLVIAIGGRIGVDRGIGAGEAVAERNCLALARVERELGEWGRLTSIRDKGVGG